jgi:site-specific recombinase XerD
MENKNLVPYEPKKIRTRPRSELARSVTKVEYLTEDEYVALLEVAKGNKEHQLLIRLLWETGLRVSEALDTTRATIYPDGINVLEGKGHKQRFVPCQSSLLGDLIRYQETHGQPRVFQKLTTEPGVLLMLKRYAKRAGLQKNVYPHLFRHSFAINFLKQTGNPFALQDIGGWSDMETIKIYMRLAKEAPREAISRMHFPEVE